MTEQLQDALAETLDYLITLNREGARPPEARAGLRLLTQRHPETAMDLLWEEEAYDRSVHYDVLLRRAGEGTVSLSFSPERALPWAMRGVHRASEEDIVRVNETVLKVDQAVACLDFIWDEAPIIDRLVNVCLIQEELERDPVGLSDAELQRAMDGFRRARRLYTAEETRQWMERRGMTHEKLEAYIADEATVAKLRDRITDGRVEGYFEQHRADFASAAIARIDFADEASAREALPQIRSGEAQFYDAAQAHFLAMAERQSSALFEVVRRGQTPAELAAIFATPPGEVVGPLVTDAGFTIVRVLSVLPARLDEPTRRAIKKILFEDWLEKRRREARIEWYWGNAAGTSGGMAA